MPPTNTESARCGSETEDRSDEAFHDAWRTEPGGRGARHRLPLAACAPTGGGGHAAGTTTSVAPTTSVVSGPHQCTAGATGTVTLGQNPIVAANGWPAANLVSVCWNFGAAGQMRAAFVSECYKPADAVGFDFASDCAPLAQIQVNGTSNPTGSGKLNFNEFRGAEPSGDDNWGIFATGSVGARRHHASVHHRLHPGDPGHPVQQQRRQVGGLHVRSLNPGQNDTIEGPLSGEVPRSASGDDAARRAASNCSPRVCRHADSLSMVTGFIVRDAPTECFD